MKATLQKTWVWLLAAVAVLVLAAGAKDALAYFTTYANASGGHTISLSAKTEINENVNGTEKIVTVANTGEVPVYVRVKAFSGSEFKLEYEGTGWTAYDDGYYYYSNPVPVKGSTETLTISINGLDTTRLKEVNVIVVQEACIVKYNSDGSTYADWSQTLTTEDTYKKEAA